MWAAERGRLATAEALLAAGVDFNIRDSAGFSALDCAACAGHVPVVKAILAHGADVDSRNDDGLSALHKAAVNNQADAIDALMEAGADIELRSNHGETPLFQAAYFSHNKSMLNLLKRGADVTACDEIGFSPLHITCFEKHPGVEVAVGLLLRWGADETALDDGGGTPSDLLNLGRIGHESRHSQEEVERLRLLLAREQADRAWRRRSWLLMLRSRASTAEVASHDSDVSNRGCSSKAGIQDREGRKIARVEAAAGVQHDTWGHRSSRGGGEAGGLVGIGAGGGAEANAVDFHGIVALLLELELEGVFRTVVSFL